MIAIVDYGMGNIRSVLNACTALGANAEVTCDHAHIRDAAGIILPGVGAFPDGMAALEERGLPGILHQQIVETGKPLLGICLGMQMLATTGTEHGAHKGLGWIAGTVELMKIPGNQTNIKLPHIGWNSVHFTKTDGLYSGIDQQADFYFVHSYVLRPDDPSTVSGECEHGGTFVASIQNENIWATQFHPEKSHKNGLKLFSNWLHHVASC